MYNLRFISLQDPSMPLWHLDMVLQGQETLHHSRKDEIDLYSHLTIRQPSGYSMDVLYPYKISLRSFSYKLTDGHEFHLLNARFAGQDKTLFFQDLSSQILSLNNLLHFEALQEFQ